MNPAGRGGGGKGGGSLWRSSSSGGAHGEFAWRRTADHLRPPAETLLTNRAGRACDGSGGGGGGRGRGGGGVAPFPGGIAGAVKCGKSDEVKKVGTVSGIICLSTAQT